MNPWPPTGSTLYQSNGALKSDKDRLYIDVRGRVRGKIGTTEATQGLLPESVTLQEKDYIAVYDKKMLWRANLYIAETGVDWNDVHPWNAPPNQAAPAGGSWFNGWAVEEEWGYNEWNYGFDGTAFIVGDGGQTLSFAQASWTPVRTKPGEGNLWNDRVAYDFPRPGVGGGHITAYDSPFDFVYKMQAQRGALRQHFQSQASQDAIAVFPTGLGTGQTITPPVPETDRLRNNALANWQLTLAPYDRWKFYWKEGANAYRPGLGLRRFSDGGTTESGTGSNQILLGDGAMPSAGTDCVGFVRVAAFYCGASHLWSKEAKNNGTRDSAERFAQSGTIGEFASLQRFNWTNPAVYAYNAIDEGEFTGNRTWFPVVRRSTYGTATRDFTVDYEQATAAQKQLIDQARQDFLQIVPGDIIAYVGHIGLVDAVDIEAILQARNIQDMMLAIRVIESFYDNSSNYVAKRRHGEEPSDQNGSWHVDRFGALRSWEIGRLRRR